MSRLDNNCQRSGPESVCEQEERFGNFSHESHGLLDRVNENRKRFRFRSPLDRKHALDCGQIKWIGRKAVECVRRNSDDAAALDESRGILDDMRLRLFVRDLKNFDRQMIARGGLRRNKGASYHSRRRGSKMEVR